MRHLIDIINVLYDIFISELEKHSKLIFKLIDSTINISLIEIYKLHNKEVIIKYVHRGKHITIDGDDNNIKKFIIIILSNADNGKIISHNREIMNHISKDILIDFYMEEKFPYHYGKKHQINISDINIWALMGISLLSFGTAILYLTYKNGKFDNRKYRMEKYFLENPLDF